ncbi:hypothetical protein C814_01134 [Anaerotruncus sp. G3(2012)]|jgi:hypothetical protein|nr:hypothetical protein C814_01134 [Anaerotruncus sp. G3(2012)]
MKEAPVYVGGFVGKENPLWNVFRFEMRQKKITPL